MQSGGDGKAARPNKLHSRWALRLVGVLCGVGGERRPSQASKQARAKHTHAHTYTHEGSQVNVALYTPCASSTTSERTHMAARMI